MEVYAPKPFKNINHGGNHKQLHQNQRRYYMQQHNPHNSNSQQYRRDSATELLQSPFSTDAVPLQQKTTNVDNALKKKFDDQELICAKCARYYQVTKDDHPIESTNRNNFNQPRLRNFIPAGFNLQGTQYLPEQYQPYQQQSQQHARLPYVLPCDHTICGDCIKVAYTQRIVKCPECDVCAAIDVENEPDTSFAINYYLIGRIYLMNHQASSKMSNYNGARFGADPIFPRFVRSSLSPTTQQPPQIPYDVLHESRQNLQGSCGAGESNSLELTECMSFDGANQMLKANCSIGSCTTPAAVQCAECKSIFCNPCSNVLHGGEIAGLKDHLIRPIQSQFLSFCPQHSANVLDFHCVNCDVDLCCYCFIEGGHTGHEHVRLTMMTEDQKVGFKEVIVNAEEKLMKLENAYKITNQHIYASVDTGNSATSRNKHHEQVVANVNKHFADLMAKLLNTHHRLRQKLDMNQKTSTMNLRSIQSDVAHRLTTGKNLLSQGRLVLESSDPSKAGNAVFNISVLRQELEQVLNWPSCLVDARNGDDKSTAHIEFISDLSENLDKFCALKMRDADHFRLVHEGNIPDGFTIASLPEIVPQRDFPDSSSQSSHSDNLSSSASISKQCDFAKPTLSPSALSVSKMPPVKVNSNVATVPTVGGRYAVSVVHINNPESIYVQLINNLPILKQIHNDLANYVKSLSASEVPYPQIGECYIVKQNIHWVRARCINPTKRPGCFIVKLLETGQSMEVRKLHMRECNAQFRQIPPLSYHCRLHNLYPHDKGWSIEAKKLLENILSVKNGYVSPFATKYKATGLESCNVTMHVLEHPKSSYSVELVASCDGTNTILSHALLFTGLAKPNDSSNDDFDFKFIDNNKIHENTKALQVNERARVSLIHVKDPYNIYVHLHSVLSHITNLLRNMNNYYLENNQGVIYTPKIGMFVSIQYSEKQNYNWYRGKIVKVINGSGKVDVLLVDFGRIVNVDYKNLRALPQKFTVLECQAIHVRLADIAPPDYKSESVDSIWPEPTMEFLREFVKQPAHHLEVAITEKGCDAPTGHQTTAHSIILFECLPLVHYCINAQLVEAGLAKSTGKLSSADNIVWPQTTTADCIDSSDDFRSCHNRSSGNGVKTLRNIQNPALNHHQKQSTNQAISDTSLRLIGGTPSFTMDLVNTIQGPMEEQDDNDNDGDDDDEDNEGREGVKSRAEVDVLLVKSPDEIYIKLKSRDPEVILIEHTLMCQMHDYYSDCANDREHLEKNSTWRKGDNIVAYNSDTAQYHRGIIQQALGDGKDGYIVLCRDRAAEFKVDPQSIYPLHEEFADVPYLSKRIRLANIQPLNKKWPLFATDIINNMCNLGDSVENIMGTNQKYYYRKTREAHVMDDGEIAQPGILWVCKLISCGPLEKSKYQYRSVNKKLLHAGVAVSDMHKNPFILRRNPSPSTNQPPLQVQEEPASSPTQLSKKIMPSYAAEALLRAFSDAINDECCVSSDELLVREDKDESSGGMVSEHDVCSAEKNMPVQVKCESSKIEPPITSYLSAIPLPERRFIAKATYVDETAHIYLHPEPLAPILTTLNENIQRALCVYNQKVLLPSIEKRAKQYTVGELCTVRFHLDRMWYRGKIMHVIPYNTEDFGFEYRVQMVDYGNVEQVRACDLNKLALCPTIPIIATRVRMHQLETKCGPWNTSVLDTIHSLVVGKRLDVRLCDKAYSSQDAIICIDGMNVNDYLLKEFDCLCRGIDIISSDTESDDVFIIEESDTSATTPVEEEPKSAFNFNGLELMPKLVVGCKRTVKVIDILSINVVTVEMAPDNMQCLKSKYEEIFSSFNDSSIEHLPLNDIRPSVNCLARFSVDGLYYRAEIMSILPMTTTSPPSVVYDSTPAAANASSVAAHVFFIDYGNREIVSCSHLRSLGPYNPLVRRLPALARMVALHRVRLPSSQSPARTQDKLLDNMTELLQQKEFSMHIIRNEPKLSVDLLDLQTGLLVYENLISQGLIVYANKNDSDDEYD